MGVIYSDYSRARIGWFFGLSGWQLATVALTFLPIAWAMQQAAWASVALFTLLWAFIVLVTVTPVRGRSAVGWVFASAVVRRRGPRRLDPVPVESLHRRGGFAGGAGPARGVAGRPDPRRPPAWRHVHEGRDHPGPPLPDVGADRVGDPPRHRPGRARPARTTRGRAGGAARPRRPDRADRRGRVPGADRAGGRRRTRPVDRPAPPRHRAARVSAGQRRAAGSPDPGQRPHRGVRHLRRPRGPARPGGQGVRRRPRRPRPGPLRPRRRARGAAARRDGDDQRRLADQPGAGAGLPHRLRAR